MRQRICLLLVAILLASGPLQAQSPVLPGQPVSGESAVRGGFATFEGYYIVPLDQRTRIIKVSPYKVDTEMLRDEFRIFRTQYIIIWTLLSAALIYAVAVK